MKSEIEQSKKFVPVKLEIIFESAFEISDFISRLKADNRLPTSVDGLIRQVEAFQGALSLKTPRNMGVWIIRSRISNKFMRNDGWASRAENAAQFNNPVDAIDMFKGFKAEGLSHLENHDENTILVVRL